MDRPPKCVLGPKPKCVLWPRPKGPAQPGGRAEGEDLRHELGPGPECAVPQRERETEREREGGGGGEERETERQRTTGEGGTKLEDRGLVIRCEKTVAMLIPPNPHLTASLVNCTISCGDTDLIFVHQTRLLESFLTVLLVGGPKLTTFAAKLDARLERYADPFAN